MSDDKIVVEPVEIPGMQITFQSPIGPNGKGMSFVLSADALISREVLDERLDIIAGAARRQDAYEQLLLDRTHLAANLKLLAKAKAALSAAKATIESKVTAINKDKRVQVAATAAAPHALNAASQHEQRIIEIEGQIAGCEERIPRWEAILRGADPDLPVPGHAMAAE